MSKYENFAISWMRNLEYLYLFLQNKSNIFNNRFYRGFNILNLIKKRYYKNKKTNNIFNNFHIYSLIKIAPYGRLFFNKNVLKNIGFSNKKFYLYSDYYSSQVYDWRFYYNVRNHLWVYKLHHKYRYIYLLLKTILLTPKLPLKVWHVNIKASIDSFIKKPTMDYCKNIDNHEC